MNILALAKGRAGSVARNAISVGGLFAAVFIAGCSHMDSKTASNVDLSHYDHVFVQHLLTDGRGIDQIIARELRRRGYDAIAGPLTMITKNAEIIVAYEDHWNFDFTNYMIQIDLQVRKARTDTLLATATYFRPSVMGRSPVEMIDAVLNKLFKTKGPPVAEPAPLPGPESVSPAP
jgi:hypothetical protein